VPLNKMNNNDRNLLFARPPVLSVARVSQWPVVAGLVVGPTADWTLTAGKPHLTLGS
jgi:hypothetical protein